MSPFTHITVCTDFVPGALAAVERVAQLAVAHHASLCLLLALATLSQAELGSMALHRLQFVPGDVLVVP